MSPLEDARHHTPGATPRSLPADAQEQQQEVPLTTDAIAALNGGLQFLAALL